MLVTFPDTIPSIARDTWPLYPGSVNRQLGYRTGTAMERQDLWSQNEKAQASDRSASGARHQQGGGKKASSGDRSKVVGNPVAVRPLDKEVNVSTAVVHSLHNEPALVAGGGIEPPTLGL